MSSGRTHIDGNVAADGALLSIRDLHVDFKTRRGVVKALNGVNLDIFKGESLGLVGETGCGKSVTAFSILNLIPDPGRIVAGKVLFDGEDLLQKSKSEMRKLRGTRISMIFQDPRAYLNPVFTIGDQLISTIMLHERDFSAAGGPTSAKDLIQDSARKKSESRLSNILSRSRMKRAARDKAIDTLKLVRLSDVQMLLHQYPHELSGGMCQRVLIAMALSCEPELLIADEATTNLDVTIQAQILELLKDLKNRLNCSLLIITHDLGVVAESCERVAVMYSGSVVEIAKTRDFFRKPEHPYTLGLLECMPRIHSSAETLETIPGNVSSLINPPSGCMFNPRCPCSKDICREKKPELIEVGPDHFVACHRG